MEADEDYLVTQDCHVTVLDIPVAATQRGTRIVTNTLLPTVVMKVGGDVVFPRETFDWGYSQIFKADYAIRRRAMVVAARLYQCWLKYPEINFEDDADIDLLVWNYLYHRLYSPVDIAERTFPTWDNVVYEVAVQEFRVIRELAQFCRKLPGCESPLALALSGNSKIFDFALPARRQDEFFTHLRVQRDRWKKLVGLNPVFPKDLKRSAGSTPRRSQPHERTPHPDEVRAQIDAETNPMYKAFWLLIYGTGMRISEGLNLWTCDVLPGSYSMPMCGYRTNGEPLVILAHPVDSTYTGSIEPSLLAPTRRMVLRNMAPDLDSRPLLTDGRHAGWKGMVEGNTDRRYSWVFWNDLSMAHEFDSLVGTILTIQKNSGSDRKHPFFFCNSNPHTKYFGHMMRYDNAYEAWKRSCERVGIPTGRGGSAPHSARHFWKWRSENVWGLSEQDRQMGLHHFRIESQQSYGLRAEALYQKLASQEVR